MGFNMDQAKKSLVMGMFLFAVTVVLGGIWAVLTGSTIQTDIKVIAMRIIYFQIFIGFYEELVFRGYIGTRLYGYFSNKQISIVITGIMFSLMHVPFHMTVAQMGFIEYILMHWINLVFLVIFHCGFQWLYSKYNSIIAPTILHFIIDFIQWFIIA
ncbi:MAG: CPBP family intramembrane metalloprotease [Clostridiales bacterium]|nr:CPBP family intramembrane metalloprotease [Clostridiales bacterium]